MTNMQVLELVLKCLSYPNQITDIDPGTPSQPLKFTWRGTRYSIDASLNVEEARDGLLIGSDAAMLMGRVLKHGKLIYMFSPSAK